MLLRFSFWAIVAFTASPSWAGPGYPSLRISFTNPVTLVTFTANASYAGQVQLQWSAAETQYFNYYELQRKNEKGIFESIALIFGKNEENNQYHFKDYKAVKGLNIYQLKLVDINGGLLFSPEVSIKITGTRSAISLFPAIASSDVFLSNVSDKQVVTIFSSDGNVIKSETITSSTHTLHIPELGKDFYQVIITDNKQAVYSGRFMKL